MSMYVGVVDAVVYAVTNNYMYMSLLLYVSCAEGSACFALCGGIASFDHSGSELRSMGPSRHGVCRGIARELVYWFVHIDWTLRVVFRLYSSVFLG